MDETSGFHQQTPLFTKRESNIGEQRNREVPADTEIESEKSSEQKKLSERSDFTICPKVHWLMKRKLFFQYQVITPDVLSQAINPDDMLAFMQDMLMICVNNLDEIRVKLERSLRIPIDETKVEPDCGQQMAFF